MNAIGTQLRDPINSGLTRFSLSTEMSRLTRDGTAGPVSRDQILRHERGQGNIHFPCSAEHEQDWQPYPVDPYSCYMCDHTHRTGLHGDTNIKYYTSRNLTSNKYRVPLPFPFSVEREYVLSSH